MSVVLMAQVAATLVMAGVIWFAQVVHYPLLGRVGPEMFASYQALNMRRTAWVVVPCMLVESATALILIWLRPPGVLSVQVWAGVGLLAMIWLSTFFVQVPRHKVLAEGFDPEAHRALVRTNWVRTLAWSARGLLVLGMAKGVMDS